MTSLLLRWLNDELQLPRKVESLERDLSSGFVFAQVLHAFGLEPHLDKYHDSSATSAKLHNMEQLALALEAVGVAFPMRLRRAILMEDRSAILQLLLQVKDFVQSRSTRKASSVPPAATARVYESARAKAGENDKPRDVDERFVAETALRLQPDAVAFRKDVNMAVHLRRFEQAQWAAENELSEVRELAHGLHQLANCSVANRLSCRLVLARPLRCHSVPSEPEGSASSGLLRRDAHCANAPERQASVHEGVGRRAPQQVAGDAGSLRCWLGRRCRRCVRLLTLDYVCACTNSATPLDGRAQ